MEEEKFENIRKEIIKQLSEKKLPVHLEGFKFTTFIIAKRIIGEFKNEKLYIQYLKTAEYFKTTEGRVSRNIRYFIEKANIKQSNGKYLKQQVYSIKFGEAKK